MGEEEEGMGEEGRGGEGREGGREGGREKARGGKGKRYLSFVHIVYTPY